MKFQLKILNGLVDALSMPFSCLAYLKKKLMSKSVDMFISRHAFETWNKIFVKCEFFLVFPIWSACFFSYLKSSSPLIEW